MYQLYIEWILQNVGPNAWDHANKSMPAESLMNMKYVLNDMV